MTSFLVGYIIVINLVAFFVLSYFKMQENQKDIPAKTIEITFIIISILGGFVGILLGSQLNDYRRDTKVIKRWIPLIVAAYVIIIVIVLYNVFGGEAKFNEFMRTANSIKQ